MEFILIQVQLRFSLLDLFVVVVTVEIVESY